MTDTNVLKPTPTIGINKAWAAGLGSAAAIFIIWAIKAFGKVEVPPEVAGAIQVLVTTGAVYFTPHTKGAE